MDGNISASFNSKSGWRIHPLDGALLFFQPQTGLHVRWDGPETRSLVSQSPRVLMFGITNRCNLSCSFCSRDLHAGSQWDVDSAYQMLAGLAGKGVLEVAFGGGEPLAFAGFDQLIRRLSNETPLALHFTTNGILLSEDRLLKLKDSIGEIRLSIYQDNPWPARVAMLARAGVRFGVNLLVTPARLSTLPALLNQLSDLGCRDLALLCYVGSDTALHLTADDDARLSEIITESPIRTKLSVCFGDRLHPLPRLFDGDCGAGNDFEVLTSDKKFKACSFQRDGIAVETADDLIRVWQTQRRDLTPAAILGCARIGLPTIALSDGIRIWQSFSGNNSGECVLVGRFNSTTDAQKFVGELLPDFVPEQLYSDRLRELLANDGISVKEYESTPRSIATVGRTVMLDSYSAGDDFPSLRTLLWRRGGRALYSAIHEHDNVELVVGIGCQDSKVLESVKAELAASELGNFSRRGLDLFGIVDRSETTSAQIALLKEVATRHNAVVAAELLAVSEKVDLPAILADRRSNDLQLDNSIERLWVRFHNEADAVAFSSKLSGNFQQADKFVIIEGARIGSRIGYFAQHLGGVAEVITCNTMRLVPNFWIRNQPLDQNEVAEALHPFIRPYLAHQDQFKLETHWQTVTGSIDTTNPCAALAALVEFARSHGYQLWLEAKPPNRLAMAIARISSDLKHI